MKFRDFWVYFMSRIDQNYSIGVTVDQKICSMQICYSSFLTVVTLCDWITNGNQRVASEIWLLILSNSDYSWVTRISAIYLGRYSWNVGRNFRNYLWMKWWRHFFKSTWKISWNNTRRIFGIFLGRIRGKIMDGIHVKMAERITGKWCRNS